MPLSADETLRYRRQLGLRGFGLAAQERLRAASVLVVGAGGLGCPALLYLAAAGLGRLVILDPDTVDVSNLQRQILFQTADAGRPKAAVAAERLRALNPHVAIEAHAVRLDRSNALERIREVDLVLDCSDNFATRYLVNDACVLAGRAFVHGAIEGFEGRVAVFNHEGGPDYRDLFPEAPPPGVAPGCSEAGVLGVLPGIVGALQASEAIKVICGVGEALAGRLWLIDAATMSTQSLRITRAPDRSPVTELPPESTGQTCPGEIEEVGPDELRGALTADQTPQLLDVREVWERQLGAIEPSDHIPLGELTPARLGELDRNRELIVYCAGGARSARAARVLRELHGFTQVRSLRGGYQAWTA